MSKPPKKLGPVGRAIARIVFGPPEGRKGLTDKQIRDGISKGGKNRG